MRINVLTTLREYLFSRNPGRRSRTIDPLAPRAEQVLARSRAYDHGHRHRQRRTLIGELEHRCRPAPSQVGCRQVGARLQSRACGTDVSTASASTDQAQEDHSASGSCGRSATATSAPVSSRRMAASNASDRSRAGLCPTSSAGGSRGAIRLPNVRRHRARHLRCRVMSQGTASVVINRRPDEVWAAIADVTRRGEWSPECVAGRWIGGATAAVVDARFEGDNVAMVAGRTVKKWTTTDRKSVV